jgi:hypothetical protein
MELGKGNTFKIKSVIPQVPGALRFPYNTGERRDFIPQLQVLVPGTGLVNK